MWPLDRGTKGREWLRIGRLRVERWAEALPVASRRPWGGAGAGAALRPVACVPLADDAVAHAATALPEALHRVFENRPAGPVTVVLESAWLPLMLADAGTGASPLGPAQMQAWMRHRLHALHGGTPDDASAWDVRIDARPGDRFVLGYALPPAVRVGVLDVAESLKVRVDALTPALPWGWARCRPQWRWAARSGWFVWPEQDRVMLAAFRNGELVALNTAAPLAAVADAAALEAVVQVEAVRQGLGTGSGPLPVGVAAWQPPSALPVRAGRSTWVALVGEGAAAGTGVAPAVPRGAAASTAAVRAAVPGAEIIP